MVAFSGGLDTSCIVSWLKEDWYGYDEVIAVLVDVGQEFDLDASIERGRAAGADDVVLVDRKAAFAEEQCARAIKTNALYEGKYPLVSALSRPVIAQAVAELAERAGRGSRRPRLHRQGERPASLRAFVQGARSRAAGDRAAPRPDLDARRGDCIRTVQGNSGRGHPGGAVLDRREPLRPGDRGRRARGSVGKPARGAVRAHRRPRDSRPLRSRSRSSSSTECRSRSTGRNCRSPS